MRQSTLLTCILMLGATYGYGQYEQTVISIGDRELTVDEAYKITDLPSTIDSIYESRELEYQLIPRQIEVTYAPKEIKAAKLKVIEPLKKLYRGFVKAGIGVYTTPLLELRYNSIRNRDWAYGISARHLSSQGGIKDVGENAYGDTHFGGWAKRYINKHTVEGGMTYDLNRIHYYGFDPGDIDIDPEDYRQSYSTIGGHLLLQSHYKDSSQVQHSAYVNLRNMQADRNAAETNVLIGGHAAKTMDDYRFALNMSLDVNSFSIGSIRPFILAQQQDSAEVSFEQDDQKGTIIRLEPSIHARKGDLTADIGLGIAIDTGQDKTQWHFYPQAYLSYSLFDDLFTPYAGITGNLARNSYHSLSQENPFIQNVVGLINTSKDLELYGGIRGTIFDNLGFNARVSVEDYDEHPFFFNDTTYSIGNKFGVVYDDLRILRLAGELTYIHDKRLSLSGRLELASNTADKLERAFNLPSVRFTLDGRYDLDDQFVVKAQIFAAGKRYGASMLPQNDEAPEIGKFYEVPLRGYVDGSLSVEYRYTKRISAFVELNNITGGRYPRWHRYQVQPALLLGGLTYSF